MKKNGNLLLAFLPYLCFWLLYDAMKLYPNYRFRPVHIADLYHIEKYYFGIFDTASSTYITPNEFWATHTNSLLDLWSGFCYITWVPVPLLLAAYWYYSNKKMFWQFTTVFLGANMLGFVIYYIYPAAPPWYIATYGFDFYPNTSGSPAGLTRVDNLLGIELFKNMYNMSSNVFAAMPSLHSANPMTVILCAWKNVGKIGKILFSIHAMGIWFAAVYLGHHYILDVIAGISCAIMAYSIVLLTRFWTKTN